MTRTILDLCERSVWSTGAWFYWVWWEQEGLDLEGKRELMAAETGLEEEECGEDQAREETTGRS